MVPAKPTMLELHAKVTLSPMGHAMRLIAWMLCLTGMVDPHQAAEVVIRHMRIELSDGNGRRIGRARIKR